MVAHTHYDWVLKSGARRPIEIQSTGRVHVATWQAGTRRRQVPNATRVARADVQSHLQYVASLRLPLPRVEVRR